MYLCGVRVKSVLKPKTRLSWKQVNINSFFQYSLDCRFLLLTRSIDVWWWAEHHMPICHFSVLPLSLHWCPGWSQGSGLKAQHLPSEPMPISEKSRSFLSCIGFLLGSRLDGFPHSCHLWKLSEDCVDAWVFAPILQPQHCHWPASYAGVGRPEPTSQT